MAARARNTVRAVVAGGLLVSAPAGPRRVPGAAAGGSAPAVTRAPASQARVIKFSGYDWTVKSSRDRVGPGPNYFSDGEENVRVDERGRLHLRLTQREGRFYCAEVVSRRSFGAG